MSKKPEQPKENSRIERLVPDTSVLIEGLVSKKIESKELVVDSVIIHEAVLAELEHQANMNKSIGFIGLLEIEKLKELSKTMGFRLEFSGIRPKPIEIQHANMGEIDSMIRQLAFEQDGMLFTADKVQSLVAQAKGIKMIFVKVALLSKKIKLESFFDATTMSVHLRESVKPYAKKGVPGNWQFVAVSEQLLTREDVQDISREIMEEAGLRRDGFIEIERPGSTIVQLGTYRIVITRPPLSDGWEITAVRPVRKLNLEDYKLSEKLGKRIAEQAEGILIAGAPGMGKSTFSQALAEFYAAQGKIVKTIEAPRDLILPDNITQYAISHGSPQEIHDILLLSRPDYTIFDEMRNTGDFRLFADLRLAGIGLAGVVHATNPIDAIQRFVGRIELGVIPQVIDTVIFIKNGFIGKVLSLNMTVKVPEGMTEADLARPVVVVNDFETKKLEYELYSYGEETVVVPISASAGKQTPSKQLASKAIKEEILKYASDADVEVTSDHKCTIYVPEKDMARIIGKQGATITSIEKKLGIGIDVQPLQKTKSTGKELTFDAEISKKHIIFHVERAFSDTNVNIMLDGDYVMTAHVGREGLLKVSRKNKIGKMLSDAITNHEKLQIVI
ncbi:MAG: PINc/VapC family ATPase [Candidatus Woesearchaeota archaeon]